MYVKLVNVFYTNWVLCAQINKYIDSRNSSQLLPLEIQVILVLLWCLLWELIAFYICTVTALIKGKLFFPVTEYVYFINRDIWQENKSTKHNYVFKTNKETLYTSSGTKRNYSSALPSCMFYMISENKSFSFFRHRLCHCKCIFMMAFEMEKRLFLDYKMQNSSQVVL